MIEEITKKNAYLRRSPDKSNAKSISSILGADVISSTFKKLPYTCHHFDSDTTPSLDGTSTSNSPVASPNREQLSPCISHFLSLENRIPSLDETLLNKENWDIHVNGLSYLESSHLDDITKEKAKNIGSNDCNSDINDIIDITDTYISSKSSKFSKFSKFSKSSKSSTSSKSSKSSSQYPAHNELQASSKNARYDFTFLNESFQQTEEIPVSDVPQGLHPLHTNWSENKKRDIDTSVRGGCSRNAQHTISQGRLTPTVDYNFNDTLSSASKVNDQESSNSNVFYKIGHLFNKHKDTHKQCHEQQVGISSTNQACSGNQIKSVIPASLIYQNEQSLDPLSLITSVKRDRSDVSIQTINSKDCNFHSTSEIKAMTLDSSVRGGTIFKNFKFKSKTAASKKETIQSKHKKNSFGSVDASLHRHKEPEFAICTNPCALLYHKHDGNFDLHMLDSSSSCRRELAFGRNGSLIGGGGVAQSVSIHSKDTKKSNSHYHRRKEMKLISVYAFLGEEKSVSYKRVGYHGKLTLQNNDKPVFCFSYRNKVNLIMLINKT